jgi:hypothetical protein
MLESPKEKMFRPLVRTNASGERVCGAKTRRGTPCQAKHLLRGGRCKSHGGRSSGPKSPAGKARALRNLLNVKGTSR